MKQILFISEDGRLRAGWRLLGQLVLYGLSAVLALTLVFPLIPENNLGVLLEESVVLVAILVPIYLARRFLDRRSFTSLGLHWSRRGLWDMVAGFAISGVSMTLLFAIFWTMGWLRVEGFAWWSAGWQSILVGLGSAFLVHLMVGISEEPLARGYWLQNLEEGLNLPAAVVIASLLFSLLHIGNPGYSWMAFFGLFVGGFDLAYGYARTRALWLPIGLHMGWNFFEGAVYGFQVSGGEEFGLVLQSVGGPAFWTGGSFGPEAGVLMVLAVGVNVGLIYLYAKTINNEKKNHLLELV